MGDQSKPAVLMMHGMDSDMMEWIMNSEEKANAFILSRAGYDVWMGNNRGSKYGTNHVTLDPKDREFWDFYQEDMGTKDLPAFIDFILSTTGLESISYVGHSEGTTQLFLGGSLKPDYFTEKINLAIMLAPVARTGHIKGILADAANHIEAIVLAVVDGLGIYNIVAPQPLGSAAIDALCEALIIKGVCKAIADAVIDETVMNVDRFPAAASWLPSGQSWRTFVYYGQMIVSNRYALYDYGKLNKEVYGQDEAPLVPIEDYNIPTAMMSGDLDQLAVPIDVEWITQTLGDKVVFSKQYHLNHGAFCLANDMSFFSVDAINLLAQYNPVSTQPDIFLN